MVHKITGIKEGTTIHGPDSIFYTIADNEIYIKQTQNNQLGGRALFETRMSFEQFSDIAALISEAINEQRQEKIEKELENGDIEDDGIGTTPNLHKSTLLRSTKVDLLKIHTNLNDEFKLTGFNNLRKAQMVEFLMKYV